MLADHIVLLGGQTRDFGTAYVFDEGDELAEQLLLASEEGDLPVLVGSPGQNAVAEAGPGPKVQGLQHSAHHRPGDPEAELVQGWEPLRLLELSAEESSRLLRHQLPGNGLEALCVPGPGALGNCWNHAKGTKTELKHKEDLQDAQTLLHI